MTTPREEVPDTCPKCGGLVRLLPPVDGAAVGSKGKEWRCANACMSWTIR